MLSFAGEHPERSLPVTEQTDLASVALVLARELTDPGNRTDLDDAIELFGFDRSELEAELAANPE